MSRVVFPESFVWGVATSAFQIEGGAAADGRGESIWDRFAATPGKVSDGSDGRVACDHYHRYADDVALMQRLGVRAYRFSVAWPRVLPEGRGTPNARGLDFYDRLVDALLAAGIAPFVTLYHWDLPQALQEAGGWPERGTAEAFIPYADAVTRRLGDRVARWITHNEPWCIATLGHEEGHHAPGLREPALALRAAHHVLLSHGWAVDVIRRNAPGAQAGIVLNLVPTEPLNPSEAADVDATRWFDGTFNRWYLDPLFRGAYPADAVADRVARGHLGSAELPFVRAGDLAAISCATDFLGVNYYNRNVMRGPTRAGGAPEAVPMAPASQLTDMGWEVWPRGLRDLLLRLRRDYAPPAIFITENGAAYADGPGADGRVRDPRRVAYLRGHLAAVHEALTAGVPVAGYFHWSLLDNFEWAHGYTKRFGLVWVDYPTQRRVLKDSAEWYREVITSRSLPADEPFPRSP